MRNKYFKLVFALFSLLILPLSLWANLATEVTNISGGNMLEWAYDNIILILGALAILMAFGAMSIMATTLIRVQRIRLLREQGIEINEEVEATTRESSWQRLYERMTRAVPIEKEKDVLLDHDYDGIQELDNILPPWWVALMYITMIFSVFYIGYYHFSDYGLSSKEEYELSMEEAERAVKAYLARQAAPIDETNVELLTDPSDLALGADIFKEKCTPCHGLLGEGNNIGPNLTDPYWLHGGGVKEVFKTIKYGVPEKGMISWKAQLRASDISRVTSYIISLKGSNPPNQKEPQGELWEEEVIQQDSSAMIGMK